MSNFFASLNAITNFERQVFPFIEQMEDRAIIIAIGHDQTCGIEINAKKLHSLGIGAKATIERRLARMKQLGGIIREKRSKEDKRNVHLSLTPAILRAFKKYEEEIKRVFAS